VPSYQVSDYASLERDADMGFYFSSPVLGQVFPRLPNTLNVGFIHCRSGKKLPSQIAEWLDSDLESPVIYISMGSIVQLSDSALDLFQQVFERLPVRVLWKRDIDSIDTKFYKSSWFPQQNLLASGKVDLFITQLGMVSLQETIYHAVPVLGIPMTYEQRINKNIVTDKNIGLVVQPSDLSYITLISKISELLESKRYKANIEKLSYLVKDSKSTALEEAVWWSEYTMKHKGCTHLKSTFRHSANLVKANVIFLVVQVVLLSFIMCYLLYVIIMKYKL